MSGSTWSFTCVVKANGVETTYPGRVEAPTSTTGEEILAQFLDHLRKDVYHGANFTVVSFTANRLA